MNSTVPKFDPVKFKESTREQWQTAAQAWQRWGSVLSSWLGPATELMLDMANIGEGDHVLDVAAGTGQQTLSAARRIGAKGSVLATDISQNILEFAAETAEKEGLTNIETRVLDGESTSDLPENSFNAAISRVGLIYFPDKNKALSGIHQALKPGGKFATITYSIPEKNEFFSIPVSIIRRRAKLPPPLPGQPGPFSLGSQGIIAAEFEKAGFKNIAVRVLPAPLHLSSATECVRFEQESFGALHQMLSSLNEQECKDTWQEIEETLKKFENSGKFIGPCELVIASGEK
jgi:SAM-dependent methyltransferase